MTIESRDSDWLDETPQELADADLRRDAEADIVIELAPAICENCGDPIEPGPLLDDLCLTCERQADFHRQNQAGTDGYIQGLRVACTREIEAAFDRALGQGRR